MFCRLEARDQDRSDHVAPISITGGVLADEAIALFKWRESMIAIRAA